MNIKSKPIAKCLKKGIVYLFLTCFILLPTIGHTQPAPPGPGNGGGNPDTPLGVPFDNNMNMLLVATGIFFAAVVLKRIQKEYKKAAVGTTKF